MSNLARIAESVVPGKRLGRHVDLRAGETRAISGPPPLSNVLRSVRHQSSPNMPLNQQESSGCTAHALVGNLNSRPHWPGSTAHLVQEQVWPLYSEEEQLLGFGPYPPNDQGGTGQYVCEAGEKLGYLDGFNYAANIHEVLLSLVLRPGIAGINWYDSFDSCDPATGIVSIAPGATVRGGHEVSADELVVPAGVTVENMLENLGRVQIWFWQSWGKTFGLNYSGRFGMTAATMATLMSQGGDFKVPRSAINWVPPAYSSQASPPVSPPEEQGTDAQATEPPGQGTEAEAVDASTPQNPIDAGAPSPSPSDGLPVVSLSDFGAQPQTKQAQRTTMFESDPDPDRYRADCMDDKDWGPSDMPAGPFPGA